MLNPANYASAEDFQRAVISRLIDRKVERGLLSRFDASQSKQRAIQFTGMPVRRKQKKTRPISQLVNPEN